MQKSFAALVLAGVLLGGAAQAAEEDVLRVIFSQVPAQSAQPVSAAETAVCVLKNISAADKNLRLGDDKNKISLYYRGRLVKSIYKPETNSDAAAWAELGGEVLDLALAKSTAARRQDFELIDVMMKASGRCFDKDTKYYAGIDKKEERAAHRRNFAARPEGENLYLKISAFNNFTKDEIVKALGEHPQAKGLILDLRASPGGQLSAAVEIADLFLDEGIVAAVRGRNADEITYYNAADGDIASGRPMVVLIDGETASAAEILAAALQEQGRAKIVGTRSFGKGTIQNLIKLPNGGTLALSSAYFYTPSGKKLSGEGIVPDVCTFEMPESKDARKLIAAGVDESCGRESRVSGVLEGEIAAILLKI